MRNSFLASYRCIDNIYRKKSFSGQELNKFLSDLPSDEKPLTTKLVYGVIDKNIELTYIIKQYAKSVKPAIMPVLQIGVYCFLYLSVPNAVAVNECVELTKSIGKSGVKSFVNAVLKNISNGVEQNKITYPKNKREYLSVKNSYPTWVVDEIIKDFGENEAEKILGYEKDNKFFHLRVNLKNISAQDFAKLLEEKGVEYKSTLSDGFYVSGNLDGIKRDLYTVQSLSSMYVCRAFDEVKDKNLLDLCAAPGGKSVYLSSLGAKVTSCDLHPHRVELIKKYAKRMGESFDAIVNDASKTKAEFVDQFDCVLCDVPCSGFGVADSKPDIKLFKTKEDIQSLSVLQKQILQTASQYVKVGGELVYSTCTIFKKENNDVINDFLANNKNFVAMPIDLDFEKTKEGYLQFLPYKDNTEGFFIAKIKRIC